MDSRHVTITNRRGVRSSPNIMCESISVYQTLRAWYSTCVQPGHFLEAFRAQSKFHDSLCEEHSIITCQLQHTLITLPVHMFAQFVHTCTSSYHTSTQKKSDAHVQYSHDVAPKKITSPASRGSMVPAFLEGLCKATGRISNRF